jgi:ParB/RepB/Spo0J family partition protein
VTAPSWDKEFEPLEPCDAAAPAVLEEPLPPEAREVGAPRSDFDQDTGEFAYLPLTDFFESPSNPRKSFDAATLAELTESIRKSGVLEALVVRPVVGKKNAPTRYEIGAGHRRYRAAKAAGVATLPCRIRAMDDAAFMELLTVSNLQRDDVHPLEEADGYRALMEKAGYDVARIAERVGRSVKYVYDRMKLLQLTKEAKALFYDGKMTAGHAIILARLSPDHQADAIASERSGNGRIGGLFVPDYGDMHGDPALELEDPGEEPLKPVSVREFEKWVAENVRVKPETIDPFLFPETAAQLAAAAAAKKKVIHITFDYRVPDAARDEKIRTYGAGGWKRADGSFQSRACDRAVLGLVVAGPKQGEAFPVCIAKEKCAVHWADWQKESARRKRELAAPAKGAAKPAGSKPAAKAEPELTPAEMDAIDAAALADLLPTWKKAIAACAAEFAKLPDLLAWNLSQTQFEIDGWADKVGQRPKYRGMLEYELEEQILPLLGVKFNGTNPADLSGARVGLGFQVWRIRDGKKADDELEAAIDLKFTAALAAKKKAAAPAKAPEPKKPTAPAPKAKAAKKAVVKKAAKPQGKKK